MSEFDQDLDVRGLNCPLPIIKARKALNSMDAGLVLRVIATDPGSVKDFEAFAKQTGNDTSRTACHASKGSREYTPLAQAGCD